MSKVQSPKSDGPKFVLTATVPWSYYVSQTLDIGRWTRDVYSLGVAAEAMRVSRMLPLMPFAEIEFPPLPICAV
jgi:hypothetical protein